MFDVADLNVDDNKVLTLIMQNRLIRQKNMREQLYKNIYNSNNDNTIAKMFVHKGIAKYSVA